MKDAVQLYLTGNKIIRKAIENTQFDFFETPLPEEDYTLKYFRRIFKSAVGFSIGHLDYPKKMQLNSSDISKLMSNLKSNNNDLTKGVVRFKIPYYNIYETLVKVNSHKLSENLSFDDEYFRYLIPKSDLYDTPLPNIRIDLKNLTNFVTNNVLKNLSGVHTLNISRCNGITDDGLKYLEGIQNLNISHCTGITDSGLQHLRNIKTLDISYCSDITDDGLKHLERIENLNVSYCPMITDAGIQHISAGRTIKITRWIKVLL
jgi:hypothetical protein